MSSEQQASKVDTIFSLGAFIENDLDRCKKELMGLEGTKQALYAITHKFEQYVQLVDIELEDHVINMAEATVAKRHVLGCISVVKEFAKIAEAQLYQVQGKIAMCDKLVTDFKGMWDEERAVQKALEVKDDIVSMLSGSSSTPEPVLEPTVQPTKVRKRRIQ